LQKARNSRGGISLKREREEVKQWNYNVREKGECGQERGNTSARSHTRARHQRARAREDATSKMGNANKWKQDRGGYGKATQKVREKRWRGECERKMS